MEAEQEQHEPQNSDSMEAEQEQHEPQNSDSMEAEQEQHEPQNSDQRAREISYKKRNPTVMKKANELSQLCNIPVCVISYGPDGNVDTWPESRDDVVEVLNKYKEHSGIHKKYPFVNKEKNNNKEEKEEDEEEEEEEEEDAEEEEDEEDDDESEEHEERNKVEEFERVLLAWEYGWLYDTDDEKLFEMRLNSLKTKLRVMKNRIELLENKKRKWSNNNNNNNNSTTGIPNNNNNYEVGSCSSSSRTEVAHAYKLMSTIRRLNLAKMSLSPCSQ